MAHKVMAFAGDYHFLSNFFPCKILVDGIWFPTVEHAYQAAKTDNFELKLKIAQTPKPGVAKAIGRRVPIKPEWDSIKIAIMHELLKQKFSNQNMADRLLGTGDDELIEGNWWNDSFWGMYNSTGRNELGKLLMLIRSELRKQLEEN